VKHLSFGAGVGRGQRRISRLHHNGLVLGG
jgi:hypothetical protein